MNDRMTELYAKACLDARDIHPTDVPAFIACMAEKFSESILKECSDLLFNESERLYAYSSECDNMRESDEAELVAEKCVDVIAMIEKHFGVEE